jgi:kynurenine 3-monooxygenase
MPPNYLHIWPRGKFMMIALPNQDKTFTVTLFMPNESFDSIKDDASLLAFFEANFPDSIGLIGKERLLADYFAIPPSPLVSIKVECIIRCKLMSTHDDVYAMD